MPPVPKKADWPNDKQAGEAEQDVEADAEQAPDQDAVDGGRREAEMGQHERRGDQPDRRQRLDERGDVS